MKRIMFLGAILFSFNFSTAQSQNDSWIISKALDIPDSQTISTDSIASYINSNFKTEEEKIRAIYAWVITNIRYSTDSANNINLSIDIHAKVTKALQRRKGICENYAAIFNELATKSGLTSFAISGYTKQNSAVDKIGHSWCAVLINKSWQLFDPTWDEGRETNTKYFMMPPAEFIQTHMPYDPLWQLLNYPVTKHQFNTGKFYKSKDSPYFNYVDSIKAYVQMDSLHKLRSSALRMQKDEIKNSMVQDNYNMIKMHIEMINQDKDVDLYNSSVADMNDATTVLNNFIQFRNNKFTPEKTDTELQTMLDGIDSKLKSSLKNLDEIDKSPATFTIGTDQVRERIKNLSDRIKEQEDFLRRYTSTQKNSRQFLFYK